MTTVLRHALGWIPDAPDARDLAENSAEVVHLLARRDAGYPRAAALPARVDLRPLCPPPAAQGSLNSCSAHAAVAAIACAENRARGRFTPTSRLFVYKAARNLAMSVGDVGATLRTTLQALVTCGAPPEKFWPYDPAWVDAEPPPFCYALAADYKAMRYFRHDPPGLPKAAVVRRIKRHLARGTPAMFGTLLFPSFQAVEMSGHIPLPRPDEAACGAHALLAVGFDDRVKPRRAQGCRTPAGAGAFRVLNSWGPTWGFGGFGWLPYDYVLQDLATDWWSVLHGAWVDAAPFARG
jgi:C1A family cysteine protease